jgi:hypothetical protein
MIPMLRRFGVLSALLFSISAFAQTPGVVATFNGTISSPSQKDTVAFQVDPSSYHMNGSGKIDFVFVMSSDGSSLDPGLISVAVNGTGSASNSTRRPDTADSPASIALVTLGAGKYDVSVSGEHKTVGAYRLDVFLAGDANGDDKVDATDVALINQLSVTKAGEAAYSALADVDRDGVINGGDRQRALANLGATAPVPGGNDEANPLEESLPMDALQLVNASASTFNGQSGLRFSLNGASFDTTAADVVLTINGNRVPAASLTIADHLLTANITLANGRNDIAFKAYDTVGRPLYYNGTLWAGSSTLSVRLVNPDGTTFTSGATIVAALSDDPTVTAQATAVNGIATFTNMPARTILVKAKGAGNETGSAGVIGTSGTVVVKMIGFKPASAINNNDLSLGTAGWDTGNAPVAIVPHQENVGFFQNGLVASAMTFGVAPASIVDQDLQLTTSGEGEQAISRTFAVSPGTTAVRIRYRFITSEVPGGYYGSQFNDYFRVSLRSQTAGGTAGENTAMNSLPLSAYTGGGSTDWREVTLNVDSTSDTIQADIGVANVGDGILDSTVIVDFVEEVKDKVKPSLSWNNTTGGLDLKYEVLDSDLTQPVTISVYFANGTAYSNRLGAAVFTFTVPSGTTVGMHGPEHIDGTTLQNDPAGTTHLIASSSPSQVGAIADVRLSFGANANAAVVSAAMTDIIKDGLRAAGASVGNISSTARTPADQARAMFNNLVNSAHTVAQNVASQHALYGAGGDAVIDRFETETAGMDRATIIANAAAVQQAMVDTMNTIGPETVSRHVGDPAVRSVVDLGYSSFTGGNGPLFVSSASPRLDRLIDEPSNHCYHLEKAV